MTRATFINWLSLLAIIALLLITASSCSTSRKAKSTSRVTVDSSFNKDSFRVITATEGSTITIDSVSRSTTDSTVKISDEEELVIEFDTASVRQPGDPELSDDFATVITIPATTAGEKDITIKTTKPVRKVYRKRRFDQEGNKRREDTASKRVVVDYRTEKVDSTAVSESGEVSREEVTKNKHVKRTNWTTMLIISGIVAIIGIFLFLLYRRSRSS